MDWRMYCLVGGVVTEDGESGGQGEEEWEERQGGHQGDGGEGGEGMGGGPLRRGKAATAAGHPLL